VAVRDVLALAGVTGRPAAVVRSLERGSTYASSDLTADQVGDSLTLLALRVDGEVLHPDHGYPLRLIAPARPGVLQTKWLAEIEVR
jgi:DMSO/TMAO reductase YedYZ molybdopterin-dependent catalytic subunit